MTVGAQVTWELSAAETLLCSTASGSIFFLIARLLTVMVSAFTDYRNIKGTLEIQAWTQLVFTDNRDTGGESSRPPPWLVKFLEKYVKAWLVSLRKDPKREPKPPPA